MLSLEKCHITVEDGEKSQSLLRKIAIKPGVEGILFLKHSDRKVLEIVENNILDLLVGFDDAAGKDVSHSFTQLLELANKHLGALHLRQDISGLSMFIGIVKGESINFSLLGSGLSGILASSESVVDIFEDMRNAELTFTYDSSGKITDGETLYLADVALLDLLAESDFADLVAVADVTKKRDLIKRALKRLHYSANIRLLIVAPESQEEPEPEVVTKKKKTPSAPGASLLERVTSSVQDLWGRGKGGTADFKDWFGKQSEKKQRQVFVVGLVVSLVLLYVIIATLLGGSQGRLASAEYAEKLDQAQEFIATATKHTTNPDMFKLNIDNAETLITEVRDAGKQQVRVAELEDQISALEKQANQIQTLSLAQLSLQYEFPSGFKALHTFSFENKQYFVGSDRIIGPHVFESSPESHPYPDGAEALFADMDDSSGRIYVYTTSGNILEFSKGAYTSVDVDQTGGWDEANDIEVYNGNVYLLSTEGDQIYKHRRTPTGYQARELMIETNEEFGFPIADFDIDGGIYLLKENLYLDKIITAPEYEYRSIVINALGTNNFEASEEEKSPKKIIGNPDTSNVYVLFDGNVWVFAPNSRRFGDVQNVTYVGQIEVSGFEIQDFQVLQDGETTQLLVTDGNTGIFKVTFAVAEGKIQTL